LLSAAYGYQLPAGLIAVCVAPWIVAFQFDSLLVAEFRQQTWPSLVLLPIDLRVVLYEKAKAAAWGRRTIVLPIASAALIACLTDAIAVVMAMTVAVLMGVLLVQISILNQLNAKIWWAGSAVGVLVLLLLAILIVVWLSFDRGISFVITVAMMAAAIFCFLGHIDWRLRTWTES